MKRFLPIISIPALVFFALSSFPTPLNAAPALSLSVDEGSIIVRKPFSIELTISWEGDAEQYLVETPRLKLPQGITQSGSSYSTSAKENMYFLRYRYTLCAATAGTHVLDPVETNYWERNAGEAQTARTGALTFKVSTRAEVALTRYGIPGALLLIFISFFIAASVLSTKKKKAVSTAQTDGIAMEEIIARELKQCRAYKISGDWDNYLKQVIATRSKLPAAEKDEKIRAELRTLAERVHYGGYRPSEDEINLIERQLEKACASAIPGEEIKS